MSAQVVITDWKLAVDLDMVLRGQGADPSIVRKRKPRLVEIAEQALEEGMSLIAPSVVYRILEVESLRHETFHLSNGAKLSGSPLSQHLAPAKQIAVIVCTLGDSRTARFNAHAFRPVLRICVGRVRFRSNRGARRGGLLQARCRSKSCWNVHQRPAEPGHSGMGCGCRSSPDFFHFGCSKNRRFAERQRPNGPA